MKILIFISILVSFLFSGHLIVPIPEKIPYNIKKAKLGKMLFFDPILSKDNSISCESCHKASEGWADKRRVSLGVKGRKGSLNSQTVLNAVFNFRQFWNGRVKTLKEQAQIPIQNYHEMAMTPKDLKNKLNNNKFYKKRFNEIYGNTDITIQKVADAISEYEKTLITPNSKFDLYLKNKIKLSKDELDGYILFKKFGCITCHNGINVGGNSFQKMGLIYPIKQCSGDRYEVTKSPFDKCIYKVPTLRNIELTAPYFHNAEAKTLKDAVEIMAYRNLGITIEDRERDKIISFLKTLTGKLPTYEDHKK